MDENTHKISKIVRELHDEMGGAIPVDDIINRGAENNISEEEVLEGIDELAEDGIISKIDEDTIEFM